MPTSLENHLGIGAKGKGSCVLASALVESLAECATAEGVAGVNADEAVRLHLSGSRDYRTNDLEYRLDRDCRGRDRTKATASRVK
jgi:hypothetical protein